jgi:preprotein translocase subunit YajC
MDRIVMLMLRRDDTWLKRVFVVFSLFLQYAIAIPPQSQIKTRQEQKEKMSKGQRV